MILYLIQDTFALTIVMHYSNDLQKLAKIFNYSYIF